VEETSTYAIFFQIMRLCFSRSFSLVADMGIHPGQMHLLMEVARQEGQTQKELCDQLCVSAPTVAVTIRRLERSGLLERRKDAADQRKCRIWLTDAGRALAERLSAVMEDIRKDFYRSFTPEEQALMQRFFLRIRDNLLESAPEKQEK